MTKAREEELVNRLRRATLKYEPHQQVGVPITDVVDLLAMIERLQLGAQPEPCACCGDIPRIDLDKHLTNVARRGDIREYFAREVAKGEA